MFSVWLLFVSLCSRLFSRVCVHRRVAALLCSAPLQLHRPPLLSSLQSQRLDVDSSGRCWFFSGFLVWQKWHPRLNFPLIFMGKVWRQMYPQYTYYYPPYLQAKVRKEVYLMFDIAFVNPTAVCHVLLDIVRYFRESVDTVVSQRCCKFVAYLRGF